MSWIESLLLGLLQGLTEYLPISSSGHLAIASSLFGIDGEQNMAFTVLVHVATVLSTLVILWKEIVWIFRDLFTKQSLILSNPYGHPLSHLRIYLGGNINVKTYY